MERRYLGLKGCEIVHIASFILVEIVFVLCLCESVDMLTGARE